MGSTVRTNDTLQITAEQGFPAVLDIQQHLKEPFSTSQFEAQTFAFGGKEGIRNFQQPPIRNFLVENRDGRHIYWGLISMLKVSHDYLENVTSGQYQIYRLYTPEQMKVAASLVGLAEELDYFSQVERQSNLAS